MSYEVCSWRRALPVALGVLLFVLFGVFGKPETEVARGETVPQPPPLQYTANVNPAEVQSGGTVTMTATISNPGTLTQTVTTQIGVNAGVEEVLYFSAPGQVIGFSSDAVGQSVDSEYFWTVDVPPGQTVVFTLVAKAVTLDEHHITFIGAFSWAYENDGWFGALTVNRVDPTVVTPHLTSLPEVATLGEEICITGEFPADDFMYVILSQPDSIGRIKHEVINVIPTRWSTTEVCFDSSELGLRDGTFSVRVESRGFYSNALFITLRPRPVNGAGKTLFLPLIAN